MRKRRSWGRRGSRQGRHSGRPQTSPGDGGSGRRCTSTSRALGASSGKGGGLFGTPTCADPTRDRSSTPDGARELRGRCNRWGGSSRRVLSRHNVRPMRAQCNRDASESCYVCEGVRLTGERKFATCLARVPQHAILRGSSGVGGGMRCPRARRSWKSEALPRSQGGCNHPLPPRRPCGLPPLPVLG